MTAAYLIDPFARAVLSVALGSMPGSVAELHEIYALLGCDTIEAVYPLNAGADVIFVDENGRRANGHHQQQYFLCRLWPHDMLAGKALWIGRAPDGNVANPDVTIDYVRDHIVWTHPFAGA